MPLFKSSRVLEAQIDGFLDTVAEGGLVYEAGVRAYLADEGAESLSPLVTGSVRPAPRRQEWNRSIHLR